MLRVWSFLIFLSAISATQAADTIPQGLGLSVQERPNLTQCQHSCLYQRAIDVITLQSLYIRQKIAALQNALQTKNSSVLDSEVDGLLRADDFCTPQEQGDSRSCAERYIRIHTRLLQQVPAKLAKLQDSIQRLKDPGMEIKDGDKKIKATRDFSEWDLAGQSSNPNTVKTLSDAPYYPTLRQLEAFYDQVKSSPELQKSFAQAYTDTLNQMTGPLPADDELNYVMVSELKNPKYPELGETSWVVRKGSDQDLIKTRDAYAKGFKATFHEDLTDKNAVKKFEQAKQDTLKHAALQVQSKSKQGLPTFETAKNGKTPKNERSIQIFQNVRELIVETAYDSLEKRGYGVPRRLEDGKPVPVTPLTVPTNHESTQLQSNRLPVQSNRLPGSLPQAGLDTDASQTAIATLQKAQISNQGQSKQQTSSGVKQSELVSPEIHLPPQNNLDTKVVLDPSLLLVPLEP